MLKNYLKTAWRNIAGSKAYSAINILGLASGMAVALLIGLWVRHEYSYDKFLPGYEQLYKVQRNFNSNGEILTYKDYTLGRADKKFEGIWYLLRYQFGSTSFQQPEADIMGKTIKGL